MRATIVAVLGVGLLACDSGGDADDKPPAPECIEIDFDQECPKVGFPHVVRRWRFDDGRAGGYTVDDADPPVHDGGDLPQLAAVSCAREPIEFVPRPVENPTPWLLQLGTDEWTDGIRTGRFATERLPVESEVWHLRCAAIGLPAYEWSITGLDGHERTFEYPENVPAYEYCEGTCPKME